MIEKIVKVSIPKTRDPFVNAQLVPAGIDKETGEARFWASTWNGISGSIGALITESGKYRLYHFNPEKKEFGFYGASYAGNDIMWLSCFLDSITKLDLKTGETETFKTGMTHDLSVSGFVYDTLTGKVFWTAYCLGGMKRNGLSFDTKNREVSAVFKDIPLKNNQLRHCVKNTDGTYTFINCVPDVELLWWDPISDSTEVIMESRIPGANLSFLEYTVVIQRADGAVYLPAFGWFDPLKRQFVSGITPSTEAAWFGADGQYAYGARTFPMGNTSVYKWNLETGCVDFITEIPDALLYGFRLTTNNKIVCLNMYGFFYRIDPLTSVIETSVKLDSDAVGHIDCLYRINEERLLCTPFITQRFFEINLKTGESFDLGRATGGSGEVLCIAELNQKIYMASYTKGQMVEYNPTLPAHFPENPRIIVSHAKMVMRPVSMCQSLDTIFYSCSHEYGFLGSTLISYTPDTNKTIIASNPLPNQMVCSLRYNQNPDILIASTTYHADCRSCIPKDDFCMVALLNPKTLMPEKTLRVIAKFEYFQIFGQLTDNFYLCGSSNYHKELEHGYELFSLDINKFEITPFFLPTELSEKNLKWIYPTGNYGIYITATDKEVEIWNLFTGNLIKKLCDNPGFYKAVVQDDNIYLICKKEIHIVAF